MVVKTLNVFGRDVEIDVDDEKGFTEFAERVTGATGEDALKKLLEYVGDEFRQPSNMFPDENEAQFSRSYVLGDGVPVATPPKTKGKASRTKAEIVAAGEGSARRMYAVALLFAGVLLLCGLGLKVALGGFLLGAAMGLLLQNAAENEAREAERSNLRD
jgi:hypothetical protein